MNNINAMLEAGTHYQNQGQFDVAVKIYQDILKQQPNFVLAHYNLGLAKKAQGLLDESIQSYEQAIKHGMHHIAVFFNLANNYQEIKDYQNALLHYQNALKLNPDFSDAHFNIAKIHEDTGNTKQAIASYRKAIQLNPQFANAYYNLALLLQEQGMLKEAIEYYQATTKLNSRFADAYYNMGNTYKDMGELELAIANYKQALAINPSSSLYRVQKVYRQAMICDWQEIAEDASIIKQLGLSDEKVTPFCMLTFEDSAANQCQRSALYAKQSYPQADPLLTKGTPKPQGKIRLGYFSADFHNHATMYLMTKMFELHNRDKFEVYAYSFGPVTEDGMRQGLQNNVDAFYEVSALNNLEIAELAAQHNIDIAIDLKGYTRGNRLGIFAHRPAPVQISFLGYPGSLGTDFIDYIIADDVVIPEQHRQAYTENIIYLPNCYQPNDNTRPIAATQTQRSDFDLPEDAMVLCCFNNTYKITPTEYDIWMRIMGKIENSVLWLIKSNQWAEKNLKQEAQNRGIDPDRIIFANKADHDLHLARHKHADLFIDTFNVNAHTTASDALWAGLPVVTKTGQQFAARVCTSLLNAVDLPELIVDNEADYEALILELCQNKSKLAAITNKLAQNRNQCALFDTQQYVIDFEKGLELAFAKSSNKRSDHMV
jgi:predicted O-linked N-acetylglucosamine transferase (SPINDLY family)